MFNSHTAKASVGDEDIKRALALLAKEKGMPFEIEVTKFFYRKKELHFSYSMKTKTSGTVATCYLCNHRRPCIYLGEEYVCDECLSKKEGKAS